jgi:predicted nucleic acid-binding protein
MLGPEHFRDARDLAAAMTASLRTLDALHLAAALRENLPLLTSDRDLARAARRHRATTVLLA